ncbi:MAG: hypothetical protein ACOC9Q_01000 [bacterium]
MSETNHDTAIRTANLHEPWRDHVVRQALERFPEIRLAARPGEPDDRMAAVK